MSSSSIPSLLASLRNDDVNDDAKKKNTKGDDDFDDWSSSSFDARVLRLLETIGEDIFREKSSRVFGCKNEARGVHRGKSVRSIERV